VCVAYVFGFTHIIYAIGRICHAISVHLSVTCVICIKTAECVIKILSRSDRLIILFVSKGPCVNLMASPPTGAPNKWGVAIFDHYAAISRKW